MTNKDENIEKFTQSKKHKKQRLLIRIGLVIIFVFSIICIVVGPNLVNQERMNQYLRDKYGREFMLKNLRTEGGGLGVEGDLTADAYERDDKKSKKFSVWEEPPGVYHDTYLNVTWNTYETYGLKTYLDNNNIRTEKQYIDIGLDNSLGDKLKGVPTLKSVIETNGNDVMYGVVVVLSGEQVTDKDKLYFYKVVDYARSKNNLNYSVRYVINSRNNDSRYICQYYGGNKNNNSQNIQDCFSKANGRE